MEDKKILEQVKLFLGRTKNSVLDENLKEEIESAKMDMYLAGIINIDTTDPLIIHAIKFYCKSSSTSDDKEAKRTFEIYEKLRDKLSLCKEYTQCMKS